MATQNQSPPADGIHALAPREQWTPQAAKRRDAYAITPDAPFLRTEFLFYSLDAWKQQGMPDVDPNTYEPFMFEPGGNFSMFGLGWVVGEYVPTFEVKVLEDRGETEIEQDSAGRRVLYFKGRRSGFMPEYVDHPVKDLATWEREVKWRLDPKTPERYGPKFDQWIGYAKYHAAQGAMITQSLAGSFMYLRAMMGIEGMLMAFYDQPKLIEACMERWLELSDAVSARHQQHVTFDEVFFAEDNCYNHGSLMDPAMIRSMLIPYYQQLLRNIKSRQIDKTRKMYVQIDTDGDCRPMIPFFMETLGMDAMSPFEVASGCDVVEIGRRYPQLMIRGGIDKRVLASGRKAIDKMLNYIFPTMRKRGGYIPCCDHGVPAEVPFEDYLYYRRRCIELGG